MRKRSVLFLLVSFLLLSCVESSKTPFPLPKGVSSPTLSGAAPAIITVSATPSNLTFGGISSVRATVASADGSAVSNGTIVTFTLSDYSLGTITPLAVTVNGVATASFTAGKTVGEASITASAGTIKSTTNIVVFAPENGSISFSSAVPQVIGIKGSGQNETSLVTFMVKDRQGNPVRDGVKVTFTLNGPGGGEYIGTSTSSSSVDSATHNGGKAEIILNSGKVAGPITITATVETPETASTSTSTSISSSSPAISIGGGVVSGPHFVLAATRLNLPGLIYVDRQSTISAYVADRFGNFNVLKGTSISFYTEAGAIDRSGVTNEVGATSVILRTQAPDPVLASNSAVSPMNGHVTVIATVMGEEGFFDANGNGQYDIGETIDDLTEPFIDKNDNGARDTGGIGTALEFEEFIDANGDGVWNDKNGVWDGPGCPESGCQESKMLFTRHKLAFTGHPVGPPPYHCGTINPPGSYNANIFGQDFTFELGDKNDNMLVPGTTITITSQGGGEIIGKKNFTLLDGVGGPTEIHFSLIDTDTATSTPTSVTVEVKGAEGIGDCTAVSIGTI